jgi:hypothetical protein
MLYAPFCAVLQLPDVFASAFSKINQNGDKNTRKFAVVFGASNAYVCTKIYNILNLPEYG